MSEIELTRITRSCSKCGVPMEIIAPYSNYDKVTPEQCDVPNADIAQSNECDNCHQIEYVYWHNSSLEKQRTEEQRELLYFKTKYLTDGLLAYRLHAGVAGIIGEMKVEAILEMIGNKDLEATKINPIIKALYTWDAAAYAYYASRVDRMFNKEEQERYQKDVESDSEKFTNELRTYLGEKIPKEMDLLTESKPILEKALGKSLGLKKAVSLDGKIEQTEQSK